MYPGEGWTGLVGSGPWSVDPCLGCGFPDDFTKFHGEDSDEGDGVGKEDTSGVTPKGTGVTGERERRRTGWATKGTPGRTVGTRTKVPRHPCL